jgi:KDO2-lipid IV(A) lauroyltransferase
VNYCRYLADFMRLPSLSRDQVKAQVDWGTALENLDHVLARGKGTLIVCMHFGNWDAGAGAVAAAGYPLTVVAETFRDPRLDRMVVGSRERLGMSVIKMEKTAPSLIRCLRRNGLLALLIDRPVPGEGVRVPFFGHDVEVPAGPARLALRTGASVVPVAFARVERGAARFRALADFSITIEPSGDEDRDIQVLTRSILAAQERFNREYPDQWYMFREMWPTHEQRAV